MTVVTKHIMFAKIYVPVLKLDGVAPLIIDPQMTSHKTFDIKNHYTY